MIMLTACVDVRNKDDAYMLARIIEMLAEQRWLRPKQETHARHLRVSLSYPAKDFGFGEGTHQESQLCG